MTCFACDVLGSLSFLQMLTLCWKPLGVRLTRAPGHPYLWLIVCVSVGKHIKEEWTCLTVILLSFHSSDIVETLSTSVLFLFVMHTPQTWSWREAWMLNIFTSQSSAWDWPIYLCICAVEMLCRSPNFFYPSQSHLNKNRRTSLRLELVKKRGAREFEVPADMHGNSDLLPVGSNQLCSWVNQFVCKIDFTQPTQSWLNIKEVKMSAK